MKVYSNSVLENMSSLQLDNALAMVQLSDDLTLEEKEENIEKINFFIRGGVVAKSVKLLNDIQAGQPDMNDFNFN